MKERGVDEGGEQGAVFVIEPDHAVCESLRLLLRMTGRRVETFSSAEDFLAVKTTFRSGCIVAEVDLPGLSGLELQDRLAHEEPGIPIIFISSRREVATAVRALRAGAVDFIQKPIVDRSLLRRIEETLAGTSPGT